MILSVLHPGDLNAYYDSYGNRYLIFSHRDFVLVHNQILIQQILRFR